MENQFRHSINGQSVLQADLNALGEASGLADDRVFAELFRMLPYNGSSPSRGIIPYAHSTSGTTATVAPNGASGSVLINPFRSVIGPRTAVGTDAKKNWRDVRSAIAVGSTALTQTQAIAANASGNPRWDLIWAAVAVDVNAATVARKVKDPTTKLISSQAVVTTVQTTVTIGISAGTPAASPVWPAVPSDAGGVYYIPLAYVRVPNGFGASSTVLPTDIATQAPILSISRGTGASSVGVADQQYAVSTARQQAWGASGTRPNIWMPPDMSGGSTVVCYFDFSNATPANWSHPNGGLVDSRDWRGRLCRYTMMVRGSSGTDASPAWNSATPQGFPDASGSSLVASFGDTAATIGHGFSQTINARSGGTTAYIFETDGTSFAVMNDSIALRLYCDFADGGKLKVSWATDPGRIHLLFWLEFTGPYTNK
jgi:hypothetical protein